MSSKKALKELNIDRALPEDEQHTFGNQSPYATPSATLHSEDPVPESSAAIARPTPAAASPQPSTPQTDVVTPRAPQLPYGGDSRNDEDSASPSAPLLGNRPPVAAYSTIPIPPSQPGISGDEESIAGDAERASRFNKFWLVFLICIVLLLILDDSKGADGQDRCGGQIRYTRNVTDLSLSPDIVDFTVTMSGMASHIIVNQAGEEGPTPGITRLIVEASATDREDVNAIRREVQQDRSDGSLKASVVGGSGAEHPECLRTIVKIIFPPSITHIRRLKLLIKEGNITVNLLDMNRHIQVDELYTRVITGYTFIKADVPVNTYLGGGFGTIKGRIIAGRELKTNLVDGDVSLNLLQKDIKDVMEAKVDVRNGNINVGLPTPYQGTFKLVTAKGHVGIPYRDPARTHVSRETEQTIQGWNSENGKEPRWPSSDLKLVTINGGVSLSMTDIVIL
ncbi:hypothetical protein BGZ98_007371 [Dissophora globulifera]|nr:hypothetical protein BGZ98_007371 [Dissophora globulifera]